MTISIWCCPLCHAALAERPALVQCTACKRDYPVVDGIPDLRVGQPSWIDQAVDRRQAQELADEYGHLPIEQLVRRVFSVRPGWTESDVARRTAQILEAPDRLRGDFDAWLRPAVEGPEPFLDLGCGPGTVLAAAVGRGHHGVGLDVSLVWLVVAKRLIRHWGGDADLAAGLAESLPLPDRSVGGVISLDVIEHVGDQSSYLREIERILRPGGTAAFVTPNRFSLSAEPHVGIWGVGWLPRSWQRPYVAFRGGKSYEFVRLLSAREARRLVRRSTHLGASASVAPIPAAEIARFRPAKIALARAYNRLISLPVVAAAILPICPFFRLVAAKPVMTTGR